MEQTSDKYPYVVDSEVRTEMSPREVRRLKAELNDLREKVAEWRCDECGERKVTATQAGKSLCNGCIFS